MTANQSKDELYELSYEVHEAFPKWTLDTPWGFTNGELTYSDVYQDFKLLTSDFLLEKLPKPVGLMSRTDGTQWTAAHQEIFGNADTPLKSLLKLTLALHKAGELDNA